MLFDIDGTLVDSNAAHAQSWVEAFAAFGFEVRFETVRPLIGMGTDKLLATLDLGVDPQGDAGKALAAKRKAIFLATYAGTIRAFPGARDLVDACRAAGAACIVASASSAEELDRLLAAADVADLMDHIVRPEDTDGSKPDPDIVRAGLDWARTPPSNAVMFGDTRFDIEAAHRSQVRCIALRCGGAPEGDLADADAVEAAPVDAAAKVRSGGFAELFARAGASGLSR